MPSIESNEKGPDFYEFASFLYDLYVDSLENGITNTNGQNNASEQK